MRKYNTMSSSNNLHLQEIVNFFPRKLIYILLVVGGLGFMWDLGFDSYIVGATLPTIEHQFHVSFATASLLVSLGTGGMGFGALISGYLADVFGRRRLFIITLSIMSIGSFFVAVAPSLIWMMIFRVVMGFGIGAEVPVLASYINEMVPAANRGKLYIAANASAVFGTVLVTFLGAYLIPTFIIGWRILYIIGAAGAFIFLILRIAYLPESLRWLIKKGRYEDAEKEVRSIGVKYQVDKLKNAQLSREISTENVFPYRLLFSRGIRVRTVMMIIWWILLIFAFWSVEAYLPSYLVRLGFTITRSLLFTAIISLASLVFYPIAISIADKFERKNIIIFTLVLNTILALLFGFNRSTLGIIVFGFFIWGSLAMFSWFAHMYTNEIFPTAARASGDGLAEAAGRIGSIWTLTLIPLYIAPLKNGIEISFITIAIVLIVMALIPLFLPKVTKKELEEIEKTGKGNN